MNTFKESQDTLNSLKNNCLNVLDYYQKANDEKEENQDTEINDKELAILRKNIYVDTVQLRELNWETQNITNLAKDKTSLEKDEVDQIQLDIQNIYYQHKHLKSEIERCKDFRSKHESLDLIPLEDLYQQEPALKEQLDTHALMISRLEDEERRRLELFVTKTKLLERKTKLVAENKQWKEDLEKLDSTLKSFVEGADPILKQLQKH